MGQNERGMRTQKGLNDRLFSNHSIVMPHSIRLQALKTSLLYFIYFLNLSENTPPIKIL